MEPSIAAYGRSTASMGIPRAASSTLRAARTLRMTSLQHIQVIAQAGFSIGAHG
jgi:hypothetical protein